MSLLRICDYSNLNLWDKSPDVIAKEWFGNFKDPRPSLYEANSPLEEVEAVAAFALTNPTKHIPYHIMRIDRTDLATARIIPDDHSPGSTGIMSVDFRHWEITGDSDKLIALVSCIHQRVVRGEERLRWIGVRLQEEFWRIFIQFPATEVIAEAQRRCQMKLDKTKKQPPFPRCQIERELANNLPAIPSLRIQVQAFLRYEERCRNNVAGSAKDDWLTAEEELRKEYVKGFLQYGGSS